MKNYPLYAVIPCHNDCELSNWAVGALLFSEAKFEKIIVVADRCSSHVNSWKYDEVSVIFLEDNSEGKSGALNKALTLLSLSSPSGFYILFCDADTVIDLSQVRFLQSEISASGVKAVMAQVSILSSDSLLVGFQRLELQNQILDHKRNSYRSDIITGQASIVDMTEGSYFFDSGSLVEDQRLTYQLRAEFGDASCLVSRHTEAVTDPMTSWKGWWAQRRKWGTGSLNEALTQPFSLTKRYWRRLFSTLFDLSLRTSVLLGVILFPSFWWVGLLLVAVGMVVSTPWGSVRVRSDHRPVLLWELYQWALWANLGASLVKRGQQGLWEKQQEAESRTGQSRDLLASIAGLGLLSFVSLLLAPLTIPVLVFRQINRLRRKQDESGHKFRNS